MGLPRFSTMMRFVALSTLFLAVAYAGDETAVGTPIKGKVIEATDNNLDSIAKITDNEAGPVFIEFYAPFCMHCMSVEDQVTETAEELASDNVPVIKVDGESNRISMARFGVSSFPTFFYVEKGLAWQYSGSRNTATFVDFVRNTDGTYRTEPGTKVPEYSVVYFVLAELKSVIKFCSDLFRREPVPCVAFITFGFALGMGTMVLIDMLVQGCCFGGAPKQKGD